MNYTTSEFGQIRDRKYTIKKQLLVHRGAVQAVIKVRHKQVLKSHKQRGKRRVE